MYLVTTFYKETSLKFITLIVTNIQFNKEYVPLLLIVSSRLNVLLEYLSALIEYIDLHAKDSVQCYECFSWLA